MLRSLIHFDTVKGDKHGSGFSILKVHIQFSADSYSVFPATFVEQAVFSPFYVFSAFVIN
jgi:hypothetical protein